VHCRAVILLYAFTPTLTLSNQTHGLGFMLFLMTLHVYMYILSCPGTRQSDVKTAKFMESATREIARLAPSDFHVSLTVFQNDS
jgi:hypothetical protein